MGIVKNLDELASIVGGTVEGDGSVSISDVAAFDSAGPGQITFLAGAKDAARLKETGADAVIVDAGAPGAKGVNLLRAPNPQLAFARLMDLFRPAELPVAGIHPKAEVHPEATVAEGASVGPFAVVERGASIGSGTVLYPNVYIGANASVGIDAILYPGVAVREGCVIGSRVIVHANAVIGSDGFGYVKTGSRHHKMPQKGIVRVGDDVEIGACVTIDRATIGETTIGRGTKIDNLVQIAHNVNIGEDCLLVAQVGIAGSTRIGDRVVLGGQAGVNDHVEVGHDVMAAAKAGLHKDIPPGTVVSGYPAIPHGEWLRVQSVLPKLPELKRKIAELEKKIAGNAGTDKGKRG